MRHQRRTEDGSVRRPAVRRVTAAAVLLSIAPVLALAASGRQSPTLGVVLRGDVLACAPSLGTESSEGLIRLVGSDEGQRQRLYGPGDAIVLDAGLDAGLQVGQEFFVRRLVNLLEKGYQDGSPTWLLHTAGWVRIVEADQRRAVATVVHACDGFLFGDFIEPFAMPTVPVVGPAGQADYEGAGEVLVGQDAAMSIGPGQFFIIGLGSDHGVKPGQRITLFRGNFGEGGPVTGLGEGVAVTVAPTSATVLMLRAQDAVYVGDGAALQR